MHPQAGAAAAGRRRTYIVRGCGLVFDSQTGILGGFEWAHSRKRTRHRCVGAAKDERLPNVPQFTGAVNVDYELPFPGVQPTLGATLRYIDERMAGSDHSKLPQYRLPDYTA